MARGTDSRWSPNRRPPIPANVLMPTANVERQSQLLSDREADDEMQRHNDRWFAEQRAKKGAS